MSVALTYPGAGVDLSQLHDELIRAALPPEYIGQGDLVTDEGLPTETRVDTVFLTMPDGTVEAAVDAVISEHVPKARYDLATRTAQLAALRESTLLRGELVRLRDGVPHVLDYVTTQEWLLRLLDVLARRDRASGLY